MCHVCCLLLLQYKGTLQLDDFASHSELEEYIVTVTADATGEVDKRVSTCKLLVDMHSNQLPASMPMELEAGGMQVCFRQRYRAHRV